MAILWCGGEDIDFSSGILPNITTAAGNFRSGWARCAVMPGGSNAAAFSKGTPFNGGATVTSAWLRCYTASGGTDANNGFFIGFGTLTSPNMLGVYINGSRFWSLGKNVAGTITQFSTAGFGLNGVANTTHRLDLQLINYGTTGTLNLYIDGNFVCTYTGDISLSGISAFNCVVLTNGAQNAYMNWSEIIVSDESTLAWQGLVTYAPSGNGTTQNFSNPAYTNFNPTTINDANSTYTNTTGQDEQATINSGPSGVFQIQAVKVIARALATAGATASNLKLGFNNTNNSTVAEGSSHALGTGFAPVEDYFDTDPTSAGGTGAWGANLTGYQLELRSA